MEIFICYYWNYLVMYTIITRVVLNLLKWVKSDLLMVICSQRDKGMFNCKKLYEAQINKSIKKIFV